MYELAAYLFLIALLISGLLTPVAIRLGRRWKVLDVPGPRKVHAEPIPLSGGWALFASLTLVLWGHLIAALAIRGSKLEEFIPDQLGMYIQFSPALVSKILPVYLGASAMFLLGLVDDIHRISVKSRMVYQIVIAAILVALGLRPSLGFLPSWVSAVVGVLWIVGITNAFNFLDGLDGLSSGVALVGSLALMTMMGIVNQPDIAFLLAALAGIQLGFLRFNFYPAKIFLGSSGSLLIGYLLSMSTLLVTYLRGSPDNFLMPLLAPLFILAVPLYDTTSVVLIRLIQKRPIAIGDQSHFHHRLMRLGFTHLQAVIFIVSIAFAVALSGIRLVDSTFRQGLVILIQIAAILSVVVLAERVAYQARQKVLNRRHRPIARDTSVPQDSETPSSH